MLLCRTFDLTVFTWPRHLKYLFRSLLDLLLQVELPVSVNCVFDTSGFGHSVKSIEN